MKRQRYADEDMKKLVEDVNAGRVQIEDHAELEVPVVEKKGIFKIFGRREKNVSPLSAEELEQLKKDVAQVNKVSEQVEQAELDAIRDDVQMVKKIVDENNL